MNAISRKYQVVTVMPDGSIFGLVHKQGTALHTLGRAEVRRVSDIQWNPDVGQWYTRLLEGPWAGLVVDRELLRAYGVDVTGAILGAAAWLPAPGGGTVPHFNAYDDAVSVEIVLVQAAQARGERWGEPERGWAGAMFSVQPLSV